MTSVRWNRGKTIGLVVVLAGVGAGIALSLSRDEAAPASSGRIVSSATARPHRNGASPTIAAPGRSNAIDIGGHEIDLSSLMARTHFAFHERDGALHGGDVSYGVKLVGRTIEIHPDASAGSAHRQLSKIGASLELRTESIHRDGAANASLGTYELDAQNGHAIAEGDTVTEDVANTQLGLEQTWRFDARPRGSGALEIRVAASGLGYVATTAGGVHFQDPASGLGMMYSHARWIDATGSATEILVRYEAGQLVMNVPAAVVDAAAYPAVLDPTVGAEYALDSPIIGPDVQDQESVSIGHSAAFNYDFLVVWQDNRRTTDTDLTYDIFGAHVDRTGVIREQVGFVLNDVTIPSSANPHSDGNQTTPRAVWLPHLVTNQGRYVVIWTSDDAQSAPKIVARVFTASGTSADTTMCLGMNVPHPSTCPISNDPMSTAPDTQPTIAVDPINDLGKDRLIVAWRNVPSGGNGDIVATEIESFNFGPNTSWINTATGAILGQPGSNDSAAPAAAGDGFNLSTSAEFIVAAQNNQASGVYGIVYTICSANLNVGTAPVCSTTHSVYLNGHTELNPAVAPFGGAGSDSGQWLLAYQWNFGTSLHPAWDIYVTNVDHSSGVNGSLIAASCAVNQQVSPGVAGFGPGDTQAFVTWSDNRSGPAYNARGARVTITNGALGIVDQPCDTGGIYMYGSLGASATHSDEQSGYFVTWAGGGNASQGDIWGANVPFTAPVNGAYTPYLISRSANKQTAPTITKCDTHYLVAWADTRNEDLGNGKDIYGAVLNSDGTVAVPNIEISGATGDQDHPTIGCLSGTGFFVSWEDFRNGVDHDIYGEPVGFDGSVADPINGKAIATEAGSEEQHPAIVKGTVNGGAGYLVVYDYTAAYIKGVMIDTSGNVLVAPFFITVKGVTTGINPDVDFDGAAYLVVWQTTTSGGNVQGASVSSTGAPSQPFTIENNTANQRYPRLRYDASSTTSTVVYEDDRNVATKGVDIYARRVTTGGTVTAAFAVATSTDDEYGPRIALRSGTLSEVSYFRIPKTIDFNYDVWGQSLNNGATSGAAFVISNSTTIREMTPGIACDTSLSCVVPYRKFDPNDSWKTDRVVARLLSY